MSLKAQRLFINLAIIIILTGGTTAAILYARGYRPSLKEKQIQGTGLISLTSYPKTAQVFLNDRLTTVTDDRIYLTPGKYNVKIAKQGFYPWTKTIAVKGEAVSETGARLFPVIPATTPLTFYQVNQSQISPDGSHLAFTLNDSPFAANNGLYILSLNSSLLNNNQITQIAENTTINFSKSRLLWSPDNSQILAIFTSKTENSKTKKSTEKITSAYLLNTKGMNSTSQLNDVTVRLPLILGQWQTQLAKLDQSAYSQIPEFILEILTKKSANVYFSPDKEKVLYSPILDIELPANELGNKLPNYNSTDETRSLKANSFYVYDLKEGTNYQITAGKNTSDLPKTLIAQAPAPSIIDTATQSANDPTTIPLDTDPLMLFTKLASQTDSGLTTNLRWFADSSHLLILKSDGVDIVDYDNLNTTNLISSPILNNLAISSSDGNRLVILTSLNQKPDTFNLISLDLK